jgi:hypothetical protein
MPAQPVQDSSHNPVLACSSRIAEAAALLITSLRGVPFVAPEDLDWDVFLGLARENGVLLLVLQSLLANGMEVPSFFTDAARQSRISAELLATELNNLLNGFARQDIDVLPLKGPALSLALYGDAAIRAPNDLDLLIRVRDFPRAEECLLGQGFLALGRVGGEYHRRFLRRDLLVELHFELASPGLLRFTVDDIWSRAHPGDFRGQPVRVMSKEDLVLYLCYHGSKHGFSRLMWIMDVARALRGWPDCDYESLLLHARRQGLEPWLFIGCEIVRAVVPDQLPEAMSAVLASSPKVAQRAQRAIAQLFSEDLEANVYNKQFHLRYESSALQRWYRRLICFAPTYVDYEWAHQHRIKPEFMGILRPFRLVKKYGVWKLWHALFPSRV